MKAHYYKMGEFTVIEISGRIEADQNKPFRDICEKELKDKSVVFCLSNLNFTASANITTFFESINMIEKVKLVGLSADFYRLLDLKGMNHFKVFKSLNEAIVENSDIYRQNISQTISIVETLDTSDTVAPTDTMNTEMNVIPIAARNTQAKAA